MKFERRTIEEASGAILAHNISDESGERVLRKGTPIGEREIKTLQELGRQFVFVAELEAGDIDEAEAARRTAGLVQGANIRLVGAATGRTNLLSETTGVLYIDANRLAAMNAVPGVTLSTLRSFSLVPERQMVASVKIIPYGISSKSMEAIDAIAAAGPLVSIRPLQKKNIHIMLLGGAAILEKLERDFRPPLEQRVNALGSTVEQIHRIATDVEDPVAAITAALAARRDEALDLLIMAGETAIMDPRDVIPLAVEEAGGRVEVTGAPVDPGNLLMIAYLGNLPILGAPGCARSPKENVVDWVLPRLLAGERLQRADITSLGHGGLLEDIKERPFPRSNAGSEPDA